MSELFFLLTFIILATAFSIASIVASLVCGYHSDETDVEIYECGMKLFGNAHIQFDIKFLNFAIIFLIFDVETIFLFPFAVTFDSLQVFTFIEVIIFVALILFALFYAIRKNILRWQ